MVNTSIIEALALKIYNIEITSIYEKDRQESFRLLGQKEGLYWIAYLLGVNEEVSKHRQKLTELANKSFAAAKSCRVEDNVNG
jgi:hypothetical protein